MSRDPRRAFRLDRRTGEDARASVDEELDHHLELLVEELVGEGWPDAEARQEARRRFGDLEGTRSYCADVQERRGRSEGRWMAMEALAQDVRYALRTLARAPGYTGLVVLTLAFGIAANTTVFSVMNPYFFRALPYGEAGELVHVAQVDPVTGWEMDRLSLPIYEDWRERSRAFTDLGAYTYGGVNLTGPEGPEAVMAAEVTGNLFGTLGVEAALGRALLPQDQGPAAAPVVVLDHGLWQRRYLADPGILGRAVMLDGVAHTVVGVMPGDFVFPFGGVRLWTPVRTSVTGAGRDDTWFLLVGRMAPGWTRPMVIDDLAGVQRELASLHPDVDGGWSGVTVLPLRQALNFGWGIMSLTFGVLLVAVLLVLAIACVNVASLTLARAGARTREVAVRTALGAARGRVIRQLVTESVVLALAGGALGVIGAVAVTSVVGPLIPEDLYRVGDVDVDRTVLAFSLVVTMATPLLFGLAPALTVTGRVPASDLKREGRGSAGGPSARGRRALVVVQVALAVVLITGAGLMLRSFAAVQDVELGFDAERTLVVRVAPPEADYDDPEVALYVRRAIEELEAVPGVEAASATLFIPLNHETSVVQFAPPEQVGRVGEEWPTAIANRTYPGYFRTLGIGVVAGRDFSTGDDGAAPPVVIVNRAMAEERWPGASPVGRTLLVGDPRSPAEATIVGVVDDVRHDGLAGTGPRAQLYRPALQGRLRRHFLVARTGGDPASLAGPVRTSLARLDPNLPLEIRPLGDVVRENLLQWSLGSSFLGVFGGGALLLATLGVYGLVSYTVSRRRRELGVRMALGASTRDIRRAVVGDGIRLTLVGLALGTVAALALGRVAAAALYGVGPFDPVTIGGVLVLFLGVAALASWVPAERASRTDPIEVLRAD